MTAGVTDKTETGPYAGYDAPAGTPVGLYAVIAGIWASAVTTFLVWLRRSGRDLPERPNPADLVLLGTASHKLSRVITKQKVGAFARAPFTEYQGRSAPAEVEERPRGTGLRRAIGELLVCPYCLSLWLATAFQAGISVAPRTARFFAAIFTAQTISDFLQVAYKGAEKKGLGD